ncbi:MAG TPA: penicillin-binding protein 1C [Nitrospirota bacterium]|nr:penicillin-binding protein 1C [Nitrospirota bacterium]
MKRYTLLGIGLWLIFCASAGHAFPSFQEVKQGYQASDAVLLDRNGKVIHELRVDAKGRRLDWTPLNNVSPALTKATIYSEDKRFREHHGVDWLAAAATAAENLFSKKPRGASTITMQLAAFLDDTLKPRNAKRSFAQKWDQMHAAQELERSWSKDEILEAYLNLVSFRGELQGVSAASRGLFNKEPAGLDEGESVVLASLLRSPNATIEATAKRAHLLAAAMMLSPTAREIRSIAENALSRTYHVRPRTALAPQAARRIMRTASSDGRSFSSTLDREIQQFAYEVLVKQLSLLKKKNVTDGAILVVENRTGNVLAYVGNAGLSPRTRYVDGIRARRQAGSTLKPFLYALAFEKRILTAASLMNDAPLDVSTDRGIYKPENYDKEFRGMVTARTALASSLNIPAVKTLGLVGMPDFASRLRLLGFEALKEDDYYGLSLALGSADVTLWELVNAYRTLANGGMWTGMHLVPGKKERSRRVYESESVFIVSDILSDREARSSTFSLENPLATRFWAAVKTGTSKDMRDNWCIGYSADYTAGVWVGNFPGAPMWDVSGITGAAPAWQEIMQYLERGSRSKAPVPPRAVVARAVVIPDQSQSARKEWFISGTESQTVERTTVPQRILYPAPGTIIAIDPDIPADQQKIYFESASSGNAIWVLNDMVIGKTDTQPWTPRQGRYVLVLKDGADRRVDEVEFEVR